MTSNCGSDSSSSGGVGARIVVGVDGSGPSMRALAWAAAEAEMRGVALEVVHVDFVRHVALEALAPAVLSWEQSVLDRAVLKAKALAPTVPVTGRICDPPAAEALVSVSEGAEMLVIGSRGLSGLKELALGSVSRECAHQASCPVVIIRPRAREAASGPCDQLVRVSTAGHRTVGAG